MHIARTRAMCGRTCACACEKHSETCVRCACVRLVLGRVMCDCTFTHFSEQNVKISCFRTSFSCFRTSFPVLEHPFPVLEHPFLVLERPLRTAYSDLEIENPKIVEKMLIYKRCAVCGCEVRPP